MHKNRSFLRAGGAGSQLRAPGQSRHLPTLTRPRAAAWHKASGSPPVCRGQTRPHPLAAVALAGRLSRPACAGR
ncbi:hypothetical protein CPT_Milagro_050 [Burkholderia phage Milagro]|uniref:Uncharacterized protein n=1 Tax=Burkholderia phage Milagro TaxID=2924901 RepID=A0AAE9G4D6_9CAUD|nr:hypothetical protein CPT_Milagro_050 [Burkholderia phage Milagro]